MSEIWFQLVRLLVFGKVMVGFLLCSTSRTERFKCNISQEDVLKLKGRNSLKTLGVGRAPLCQQAEAAVVFFPQNSALLKSEI